ncbi:hypothetical protein BB560_002905, partial [Smittium megazygosporum]
YNSTKFAEYSKVELLQMIGRAGRPQFDDFGVAVMLTSNRNKLAYERMLNNGEVIESTVTKNPNLYKSVLSGEQYDDLNIIKVETSIQELVVHKVMTTSEDLERFSPSGHVKILPETENLCNYCITQTITTSEILEEISKAIEFEEFRLQQGEKSALNEINKNNALNYPLQGNVKNISEKVFILLQCHLLGIVIRGSVNAASLNRQLGKINENARRVCKGIVEYYIYQQDPVGIRNSLKIIRYLNAECFDNCSKTLRQVEKIGPQYASILMSRGITNINSFKKLNPGDIESFLNRNPPFGTQVINSLNSFPELEISVEVANHPNKKCVIDVSINVPNFTKLSSLCKKETWVSVLVSSSAGRFIRFARTHISKLSNKQNFSVVYHVSDLDESIIVHAGSDNHGK